MPQNIRILTKQCCERLLTYSSNKNLRSKYNNENFDENELEFLKKPTQYFIDDEFILRTTSSPLSKDDCKNSIELYKQLQKIDRVQANDKRLWVSLTHTRFFSYTKKRWKVSAISSDDTIKERFHFEGTGIEARMRNAISRLWWAAKITYDQRRENPFELTEVLWEKQDIYTALVERSFVSYPNVVHGFLDFYKRNKHLKEDDLRALLRGLNAVGGVKILPLIPTEEMPDELRRVADYNRISVN